MGTGSELRLLAVEIKHTKEGPKTEGNVDKNTQEAPCHCDKRIYVCRMMVAHAFNPSPQAGSVSSRPVWSEFWDSQETKENLNPRKTKEKEGIPCLTWSNPQVRGKICSWPVILK